MRIDARLVLLAALLLLASSARGEVFASQAEALAAAFPTAERIEQRSVLLDDAQAHSVEQRAQAPLESRLVTLHTAWREGRPLGYAFVDVHEVRTLPEALLVVIAPDGKVVATRMLAFYEPKDYLPSARWLRQFDERSLTPDLRIGGAIHGIAGATLSSRAVTSSVRRALALFALLVSEAPGAPAVAHAEER